MNPSILTVNSLDAIARLAYGSGSFEGINGGNGNMGAIKDENGNVRVVKFQSHWTERLFHSDTAEEKEASNLLRDQLIAIAGQYGVSNEVMNAIRQKLGIQENSNANNDNLLKRTTVAEVVRMIDGNVWDRALKDGEGKPLEMRKFSSKDTSMDFVEVKNNLQRSTCATGKMSDIAYSAEIEHEAMIQAEALLQNEGRDLPDSVKNVFRRVVAYTAFERGSCGDVLKATQKRLRFKVDVSEIKEDFKSIADVNFVRTLIAFGHIDKAKAFLTAKTGNPDAYKDLGYTQIEGGMKIGFNLCNHIKKQHFGISVPEAVLKSLNQRHLANGKKDTFFDDSIVLFNGLADPLGNCSFHTIGVIMGGLPMMPEFKNSDIDEATKMMNKELNDLAYNFRQNEIL